MFSLVASNLGRTLQVGDEALTDFDAPRVKLSRVRIIARKESRACQSGILFRVSPELRTMEPGGWLDADWFEPVPEIES